MLFVCKSFIASALGHHACAIGYKVAYFNMAKLFTRLHGANADNSLYKEISRIEKQNLLILDDFGLQNLDKPQRDLLMEIIEDRHNKQATIIASQLKLDWMKVSFHPGSSWIEDNVFIFIYNSTKNESFSFPYAARREDLTVTVNIPAPDKGDHIHCWIFMKSYKKKDVSQNEYLNFQF
nr:DUF6266 family protein [Pedobacter sp. L105]